jgi:hypothetical protein
VRISLHQRLSRRERRVAQRIEKKIWSGQSPMIAPPWEQLLRRPHFQRSTCQHCDRRPSCT